jgi:hypothetical protein
LQQLEHLAWLGEAVRERLREDDRPVVQDVELAASPLADRRVVSLVLKLGRETRGPFVVAASDGAIENLDAHARKRRRSDGR